MPRTSGLQVEVLTETLWNRGPALASLLARSQRKGSKRTETLPKVYQRQNHLTSLERAEVARRYEAGDSMGELAIAFGCHRSAIRRAIDHLGVERRDWRTRKVDVERARERYEAGCTAAQIASDFGVSATAVLSHLRRAGVVRRPRGKPPTKPPVQGFLRGGGNCQRDNTAGVPTQALLEASPERRNPDRCSG
jgi:transposase-like protein